MGAMALTGFDYGSERARLARLSVKLTNHGTLWLGLATLGFFALGGVLLAVGQSLGYLIGAFGWWPLMAAIWNRRHLRRLPAGSADTLDGRLETALLGRLPRDLTPQILAQTIGKVTSAQFLMVRSGLSTGLLVEVLGEDPSGIPLVWSAVRDMQPTGVVRAATVVAALTRTSPQLINLLPHLQLQENDLPRLAGWYNHLDELIERHKRPVRTGGIARDWNFGYLQMLDRFGLNLSERAGSNGLLNSDLESHRDALEFMQRTFSQRGRQNVALVGPRGVGKSTIVNAFAASLMNDDNVSSNLRYRQVFSLDAASLIAAAAGRGQLEDLLHRLLSEAYRAKNVILCLDDAELFFEEGVGSVDLANVLLPVLEGGGLRIILTMDEQRWLQISARNPALAGALNRITVAPASPDETMAVLQDQLIPVEYNKNVTYMYQALKASLRLSDRYLHDQAQPGRALQLLSASADYAEDGLVTAASVTRAIEQTRGVKVGGSTDTAEKQTLLNLEDLLHKRMIGQVRAVHVVSDALRRARAGVRNEQRPVGTFLFLGPTGTGKTELAKSLAAIYFGGEDRLIRLDLNEFVRPEDVGRLIADGAIDPMSLSAQVMKQPFSVILLDEIEKAHPSVLTALLQVLDEGILRDANGREVNFRDAIVIATSNAGADQIRHHVAAGEPLEAFEHELQNELITSGQFRPEFLNRFDETVLFTPLGMDELRQIIDLMLAGINKTLANQQVSVSVDEDAKVLLIQQGYDPQLGARPLRRVVQRTVESLVAKRLLGGDLQPGQTLIVTAADITG
jgi:ATP-dependent Clp protease ATP-binding subunit ClpC